MGKRYTPTNAPQYEYRINYSPLRQKITLADALGFSLRDLNSISRTTSGVLERPTGGLGRETLRSVCAQPRSGALFALQRCLYRRSLLASLPFARACRAGLCRRYDVGAVLWGFYLDRFAIPNDGIRRVWLWISGCGCRGVPLIVGTQTKKLRHQ